MHEHYLVYFGWYLFSDIIKILLELNNNSF